MKTQTLSNYEALLALSTSPTFTPVVRGYVTDVLAEHRAMVAALRGLLNMIGEEAIAAPVMRYDERIARARAALAKVGS